MTDESLDAIAPAEEVVQVGDHAIRVRPLTIGQLPAFSRAIAPAVPVLQSLFAQVKTDAGDEDAGLITIGTEEIQGALAASGALVEAVRIGAALEDRKWYEAQGLDVLVRLAGAVFAVNADFFGRALAPAAVEVAGRALSPTGTPSSPVSSAMGSPATTS